MRNISFIVSCLSGLMLLAIVSFVFGASVQRYYPNSLIGESFDFIEAVGKVDRGDLPKNFRSWLDDDSSNDGDRWFNHTAGFSSSVLVSGGLYQFLEFCPETGCLAVEFDQYGEVKRSWPFRPDLLYAGAHPSVNFGKGRKYDWYPFGLQLIGDGDLILVPAARNTFPNDVGIMRISDDGSPIWRNFDGSHHWPKVLENGEILVTARFVEENPLPFYRTSCSDVGLHDVVRFLSENGKVRRQFNILEAFRESQFRGLLDDTTDPCDPLHVNYIDVATSNIANKLTGIETGDLLLSMRNISAISIVDGESGELKRVVRGTFVQQHSAQFLADGRVVLFDNLGGSGKRRGSRILALDLTFGNETTIYPRANNDPALDSFYAGQIDISPDGKNLLVAESHAGSILELEIKTGKIISRYTNTHNLLGSAARNQPNQETGLFEIFSAYYTNQNSSE